MNDSLYFPSNLKDMTRLIYVVNSFYQLMVSFQRRLELIATSFILSIIFVIKTVLVSENTSKFYLFKEEG